MIQERNFSENKPLTIRLILLKAERLKIFNLRFNQNETIKKCKEKYFHILAKQKEKEKWDKINQ